MRVSPMALAIALAACSGTRAPIDSGIDSPSDITADIVCADSMDAPAITDAFDAFDASDVSVTDTTREVTTVDAPADAGLPDPDLGDPHPALLGYSHGNIATMTLGPMNTMLDAIQAVGNDTTFVRTDVLWMPGGTPDFAGTFDAFVHQLATRHLRWLPTFHLHDSMNEYALPTSALDDPTGDWAGVIASVIARYAPGGTVVPTGSQPPIRFEFWNEPQTGTGLACSTAHPCERCSSLCTNTQMCVPSGSYSTCATDHGFVVDMLRAAHDVVTAAAAARGMRFVTVGAVLGGIDMQYLEEMHDFDNSLFNYMDSISVHVYPGPNVPTLPPTQPYGTPGWDAAANAHRVLQLQNLRAWMNDNGGGSVGIYITEGGYSGTRDACHPTNVFDLATQSSYDGAFLAWLQAPAQAGLLVRLFSPYNPIDTGAYSYPQAMDGGACVDIGMDTNYWQENLAAVEADGSTLRPWGTAYRAVIASTAR